MRTMVEIKTVESPHLGIWSGYMVKLLKVASRGTDEARVCRE